MRTKALESILDYLGLRVIEVKDRHHQHYLARSDSGELYLVIVTNRALWNPKVNGIPYNGKMFGIRKSYVDYELVHSVSKVLWIYRGDAFIADAKKVRKFIYSGIPGTDTCIKRRYEVVCHYPLDMCVKVTPQIGLSKFLEVVRYAD